LDIIGIAYRYSMRYDSRFNEAKRIGIQVAWIHSCIAFPSIIKNYWQTVVLVLVAFGTGR
jgi:hypothetical protein